jgi:CheY-like chemotaxis protein
MTSPADDRAARVFEAFREALGREPVVASAGLERALQHSLTSGLALQDAVVALDLIDEPTAYRLLAAAAHLPFADLHNVQPSPLARHLVPTSILRRHQVLPVAVGDKEVLYVTATPCNPEADRAVSMSTGRGTVAMLTCRTDLRAALANYIGSAGPIPSGARAPSAKEAISTRPSVLIVDDEATTRTLVRLLLERDGYRVIEAFNGRHALDVIGGQGVDLVVMDLLMPELDGYDAIRALRQHQQHATTPIVVVTTEEGPSVEKQLLDLGADDYILKPFEPTVLTSRIKAAFRRQRLGGS